MVEQITQKTIIKMRYILKIVSVVVLTVVFTGCEYFKAPDATLNVQQGEIKFPAIALNGEALITFVVGTGVYEEQGAVASLGADDISEDIVTTGSVDSNVPGVYQINYFVSTINSLGQPSQASVDRFVLVTSEDLTDVDLSGPYQGSGFGNQVATVTKLSTGWYHIDKILASGNNIAATWAHIGGDIIEMPNQPSPFGDLNTTAPGASASLTTDGFEWSVFVGCCGVFGPITFVKL